MPWFHGNGNEHGREPISYRAWKWLFQHTLTDNWDANLFDRIESVEWDVLIILDACRYDTLFALADWAVVDRAVSPATATGPFLTGARDRGVFDDTIYISANPQSERHIPGDNIDHIPIYNTHWNDRLRTVKADAVYDEVYDLVEDSTRIVAHTVQPHYPHICRIDNRTFPVPNGLHPAELPVNTDEEFRIQSVLSHGLVDLEDVRKSYRISVRYAWETAIRTAAKLVNQGQTVVITADHGELFGEWGFVEHPTNVPLRALIDVPWVVFSPHEHSTSTDLTDRLAALGYVDECEQ